MQNQIKAEICPKCQGKGILGSTGKKCDNCQGVGAIGTDGVNEYYLAIDEKGNLRVADIKSSRGQVGEDKQIADSPSIKTQRRGIIRGLFFVGLIITYGIFLAIYFTLINQIKVFYVVTIIFGGFIILYLLFDTNIVGKFVKIISKMTFKEPDDFLSAMRSVNSK